MILDVRDTESLCGLVGEHLGHSRWVQVGQYAVDEFGRLTHDTHWSHTDPEQAAAYGFDGTTVHGYFTLALVGGLFQEVVTVEGATSTINYGLERVRFLSPVRVGSFLRLSTAVESVTPSADSVDVAFANRMELRDSERPACVARSILRFVLAAA